MNNSLDFTPDTTLFKKYWLPLEQAIQRVARFERDFGKAHLTLACHAALPSILTPELVNLIRINFLETSVDWIAECDLLLSSLCQPIDQGIFEIEPQIRQVLLIALQTHLEYGPERLEEIAQFLYKYSETERVNALPAHIKRTYQWISGAYLDPDTTIQNMFDLLKDVQTDEFLSHMPDYLHIGKTLALIANPLEMTSLQVELDDLVGTAQLSTLYWTGDKENLLGLLQSTRNDDLDEITHALTKPVVNWLATSEFVTSEERSVSPLPVSLETPVAESTARTERKPVTIFCSCAYKDEELQRELAGYLAPLQAQGLITYWHDPMVPSADIEDHRRVVDEYLNTAQIILLLISHSFIGSDYHYEVEMTRAMERHEQGDVRVIPIILRPTHWQEAPFSNLQALPINAIPIITWEDQSLAFAEVVSGIERVAEELQTPQSLLPTSTVEKLRASVQPLEVFLVYAHEDTSFLIELENYLSPLREQGLITTWSDRQITPGADRRQVIDIRLEQASLILLLVSPHFLMSDECSYDVQRALQHFNAYGIPVILRPCIWKEAPFASLKSLPTNNKPISIWEDRSAAFADVVGGIYRVVEQQKQQGFLERSRPRELQTTPASIEIFFVYDYDDEAFFDEIYNHIYPLRQKGLITIWPDFLADHSELEARLERASLILLLVSPHFLNSHSCNRETQKALQRHQANGVRIIPIIVRPCNWENEHFASLQVLPTYSKPITNWSNQDVAIADVTDGIQRVIDDIKEPQTLPEIRNPMETGATILPIEVFVAYAHEDEALLTKLENHLRSLYRKGLITIWSDRQILPGTEWKQEIDVRLKRADIILLLVSPHFLTSNYSGIEMRKALERHQENEARVIPIIVRPCEWSNAPFARLPVLPTDTNPVTNWGSQDEAFFDVVTGIRHVVEDLQTPNGSSVLLTEHLEISPQAPFTNFTDEDVNAQDKGDEQAQVIVDKKNLDDLKIFISYAPEDEKLLLELEKHLASLNRQGLVNTRYKHKIEPGFRKQAEISQYLNSAQIVLLLVSPDVIASDYCYSIEMQSIIERHNQGEAYVIPILLRPTYWQDTPLKQFSMLPNGAIPIMSYQDQDQALLDVVVGIVRIARENIFHDIDPSRSSHRSPHEPIPIVSTYLPSMVGNKGVASFFLHEKEHILHFTRTDSIANAFRLKSLSKLKNQTLLLTYNQQELVRDEIPELPTLRAIVKEHTFQIEGVECVFTFKMSAIGFMSVQVKVGEVIVFSH
jgi:hypothetical protein